MTKLIFPSVALIAATMLATSAMARETHVSSRPPLNNRRKSRRHKFRVGSPSYWRRQRSSRVRESRCVGPLGELLRAHDSLGSMTNAHEPPNATE